MSGFPDNLVYISLAALGTAALYQGLVKRVYTVETDKWSEGAAQRIVVVADLHSQHFGERQQTLLGMIRRLYPDYILLPGDIVDERVNVSGARIFLEGAARIAPTFYAPGNHEYRTGRMNAVFRLVEQCGVTVLADRRVELATPAGPLILAGCEDPEKSRRQDARYNQQRALTAAFQGIGEAQAYTILLAHRPEHARLYHSLGFDMTVSGHAHGGQLRIPWLLNGVYATGQGVLPLYTGGVYTHGKMRHVVSRGLAKFPYIPRVFNPPEIVLVEIRGAAKLRKSL